MKRRNFLKRLGMGGATVVVSAVSVSTPILAEPAQEATIGFSSTGILKTNEGVVNTILDGQKYWALPEVPCGALWCEGNNIYYRSNGITKTLNQPNKIVDEI